MTGIAVTPLARLSHRGRAGCPLNLCTLSAREPKMTSAYRWTRRAVLTTAVTVTLAALLPAPPRAADEPGARRIASRRPSRGLTIESMNEAPGWANCTAMASSIMAQSPRKGDTAGLIRPRERV